MFMNVAYLNNSTSTVVDNMKPLIVTSCGNYRVKNRSEVEHIVRREEKIISFYILPPEKDIFSFTEKKKRFQPEILLYICRINHRNMFIIVQIKPMFIGCILPEMK